MEAVWSVVSHRNDGRRIVFVGGRVTADVSTRLERTVREAAVGTFGPLLVELSRVEEMSPEAGAALGALAGELGTGLVIVGASQPARTILRGLGLEGLCEKG